jgi:hypothetical protein
MSALATRGTAHARSVRVTATHRVSTRQKRTA